MNGRVLVLNASFEPINVCNERRAVVMIFKGVARMEEHNGHMLHSAKLSIHAPSVIRLVEYIHIPFERRSLSRKNILLRDHSPCQYCGKKFSKTTQSQNLGSNARWGDALMRAQAWAYQQSGGTDGNWYLDLSKTESILGDPAMPIMMKAAAPAKNNGNTPVGNTPATAPGQF